jgi:hypothetical protein
VCALGWKTSYALDSPDIFQFFTFGEIMPTSSLEVKDFVKDNEVSYQDFLTLGRTH